MTIEEQTEWYLPFVARHSHNPEFLANEDACVRAFIGFLRSCYPHDMNGFTVVQCGDNIVHAIYAGNGDEQQESP